MATIRERTDKYGKPSYTVEIRLKGYPRQTATFKRLTDAKKWTQDIESAIRNGKHFKTTEAKKHTFADAIDRYISDVLPVKFTTKEQGNRRPILAWWREELGVHIMADLSSPMFAQCRDSLAKKTSKTGKPFSADSVKKYFGVIQNVLKYAVNEWQWLEQSPLRDKRIEMPELPPGRIRFLDDDERKRLTTACRESENPLLYPAFILALSTGMRQGELMNLYWKTPSNPPAESAWGVIHMEQNAIVLHSTKNGERRRVPLVGLALQLVRDHAKVRRFDSQLLFPSPKCPQKPIELKKAWLTALKQAEVENFRWHDLRHTTASYLAMNGASLAEIAEVMGHKTLAMVKRYAHLSDGHVSNVVANMSAKIFGGV
ncbi:MAG: site-specific integrase [Proteobacteria bacterium]|nr:site-specific integrase [Pseudomonadota bacterium]